MKPRQLRLAAYRNGFEKENVGVLLRDILLEEKADPMLSGRRLSVSMDQSLWPGAYMRQR